jgi:nucleoid-associated protein YejK
MLMGFINKLRLRMGEGSLKEMLMAVSKDSHFCVDADQDVKESLEFRKKLYNYICETEGESVALERLENNTLDKEIINRHLKKYKDKAEVGLKDAIKKLKSNPKNAWMFQVDKATGQPKIAKLMHTNDLRLKVGDKEVFLKQN